jgi:hypothetical protein
MRFTDAYADRPIRTRDVLAERIRQLKCAYWADPGDVELKQEIEKAEQELRVFDARAWERRR